MMCCLSSCSSIDRIDILSPITLHFHNDETLKLDSIAQQAKLVQFDAPNVDAIIGRIDRLLFVDNNICVVDSKGNKLILFSKDGKFIKSTSMLIGHGHDEYISLKDAALDEYNKRIYMYSDIPRKMFVFDYELNLINSLDFDERVLEFVIDNIYIYYMYLSDDQTSYEVRAVKKNKPNSSSITLAKVGPVCAGLFTIGKSMNQCGGSCYACLPFENKIYRLQNGKIHDGYVVDFGDMWFADSSRTSNSIDFNRKNIGKFWCLKNISTSDSNLVFSSNKTALFVIDRTSLEGNMYLCGIDDRLPFLTEFSISTQGLHGIIAYNTSSNRINDYVMSVNDNKYQGVVDKEVFGIVSNHRLENNPLVVIWHLK